MAKKQLNSTQSFIYACLLHAVLIITVIFSVSFAPLKKPETALPFKQADKIVQAVAVNQTQVEQEINKLKTQKAEKRMEEEARVTRLKREAEQAEAARKAQQVKLAQVKQEQLATKEKAQAQLKKLNEEKAKSQQQLANIQAKAKSTVAEQAKLKADIAKLKQQQAAANKQAAIDDFQKQIEAEQTQLEAQQKQAKITSEIQKYTALITQAIQQNWNYPANVNKSLYCVLEIKLATDGSVTSVKLVKSSGNQLLDQSAIAAVYKSSPLPISPDPQVYKKMHDINLKASPISQLS